VFGYFFQPRFAGKPLAANALLLFAGVAYDTPLELNFKPVKSCRE
jgi:hypothetical protein